MQHKRTPYLLAASALLIGAGAGVGSYAAFGGNGGKTTTIVQQAAAHGSPTANTKALSVNGVYRTAGPGVVEITTTSGGMIMLDADEVRKATPRILQRYHIPRDRTADLPGAPAATTPLRAALP